ncbi:hypothetical protein bhYOR_001388 (plasmid) [Borrelia nietonii YOR]|uniref:hypothetical protein n=1 Tax=Borrelia nietonii TaxID=3117462 RepID=UPI001FF49339|nr:hypothetical protein [Borrelia nietonii]UPA10106.1 hypothetical protein bhYOR_001388 [Borrelia nietonii YOR]
MTLFMALISCNSGGVAKDPKTVFYLYSCEKLNGAEEAQIVAASTSIGHVSCVDIFFQVIVESGNAANNDISINIVKNEATMMQLT